MNNNEAASIAADTVKIIDESGYALGDEYFDLTTNINYSKEWTKFYEQSVVSGVISRFTTSLEVTEESTLQAAQRLREKADPVGVLNFASAKHPGGGFLRGALAQEESIARSSTLYATLKDQKIYEKEKNDGSALYGHWAIYSPSIIVFKDDDGTLLKKPYDIHVVTCPAPNTRVLKQFKTPDLTNLDGHLVFRVKMILSTFYMHNINTLVLGAWGCGVFGNNPRRVAEIFHYHLNNDFKGAFSKVTFAVYTAGDLNDPNYVAFKEVFS